MSELNVFGNVEFIRNKRTSRISVKILVDGLRVSLPSHANEKDATRFILAEKERILLKQRKVQAKKKITQLTPEKELVTLTFIVKLVPTERADLFFSLKGGVLRIEYPGDVNIKASSVQKSCWNGVNYFLKKEAKRILPQRVNELALQFGFDYSVVKIQSSKTRWGSCSKERNINLSFYLMLLPQHLIDYVILHELCHTHEMNHGEKFWLLMDEVTGGKTKKLRAEMKHFEIPS